MLCIVYTLGGLALFEITWRLILNLSSPEGASVNNGINRTLCSLSYATVNEVAGQVERQGRGALIAKRTLKLHIGLSTQMIDWAWDAA